MRHLRTFGATSVVSGLALVGACSNQSGSAATTEEIATAYIEAWGAFDLDEAESYLADDARLLDDGGPLSMEEWRRLNRWLEATAFKLLLDSCEAQEASPASEAVVTCAYDYHLWRSDEVGRGPFSDNTFTITVGDGEIVSVDDRPAYVTNGFSQQMWSMFSFWIGENHPEDLRVLYDIDDQNHRFIRMTEDSLPLWEQRIREYAEAEAERIGGVAAVP